MLPARAAVLLPCLLLFAVPLPAQNKEPDPIKIGMNESLFVDVSPFLVKLFAPSFNELCKECTGFATQMVQSGNPFQTTKLVRDGQLHFGVYQGVEFAWAWQKHGDLVPLMVAINRHPNIKAHLVVRKDSPIVGFACLKGKDIAYPLKNKEHCRLFLERHCADCGQCEPKAFFSQVTRPGGTERALDDVCHGTVPAAIVETVALESYQAIKPGCFARLKVVKASETFPVGVIAYRKGNLTEATLAKFRAGMINANKNERTREMMHMYQITAFEPVPSDYAETCAEIAKAYPPPEALKVSQK
ncbi:MAG: PhnD/SsuA/transferrin family substrate-binding protein [Gemmataceae bacterium]|nr:PhnD/SsuA/transferrin family substrate-binding protein [Gemmataceae bacterium]